MYGRLQSNIEEHLEETLLIFRLFSASLLRHPVIILHSFPRCFIIIS